MKSNTITRQALAAIEAADAEIDRQTGRRRQLQPITYK
jgi:hypothetical protein